MDNINYTRRNMRYLGQIESHKYNNTFNETESMLAKLISYYVDNIKGLKTEIETRQTKKEELKQQLFHLNNKKNLLEKDQGGAI